MKGHFVASAAGAAELRVQRSDKLERSRKTGAKQRLAERVRSKFLIRLMQANAKMFDKFGRLKDLRYAIYDGRASLKCAA